MRIHMTEADINPVYIRDFLGHSDLKTTQIYSKSSVEMKRKALEKLTVCPPCARQRRTKSRLD